MKLQRRADEILNNTCNKKQITKSQGDYMVDSFFKNMKKHVQTNDMPTVMIHRFGEFTPSLFKINKRLKFLKRKREETGITETYTKKLKTEIDKLQKVKDRLDIEKRKRNN